MAVPLVFFFVLGIVVVLMVLIVVTSYLSAKRRRESFTALAAQRGWTYAEQDDRWIDRFEGAPFGTGRDRRALNVFSGMRRAQKEGRWMGTAPIGYINKISEQGSKYIAPDPRTAHHIQWIFQQLATGTVRLVR